MTKREDLHRIPSHLLIKSKFFCVNMCKSAPRSMGTRIIRWMLLPQQSFSQLKRIECWSRMIANNCCKHGKKKGWALIPWLFVLSCEYSVVCVEGWRMQKRNPPIPIRCVILKSTENPCMACEKCDIPYKFETWYRFKSEI